MDTPYNEAGYILGKLQKERVRKNAGYAGYDQPPQSVRKAAE